MEFQTLLEDIVYEHKIPVKTASGNGDMDLVGGDTIDLSHLVKANILSQDLIHITPRGLHIIDPDEAIVWRMKYEISDTHMRSEDEIPTPNTGWRRVRRLDNIKNLFIVIMDLNADLEVSRIRVSFESDTEFTSYTSKNHNIILPQWMIDLTRYKITKKMNTDNQA